MDPAVFGYIRVSQAEGESGLATQRRILTDHGLRDDRIFTDVASGRNMRRPAWKQLREILQPGDVVVVPRIDRLARNLSEGLRTIEELHAQGIYIRSLAEGLDTGGDILVVVAIDRIGRRWMDTVNAVRDLRTREVRIRSLAQSEATWVTYLASEPDTAEAVIGDILTTFMAWAAEQELQAVSRRTRAGLERARAEGKTLGPPPRVDDDQVEDMARLRREGQSFRSIGRIFGVSRTTVQRRRQEQEAVNLEDLQTS